MVMIFHHDFNRALPWLGRRVNISRGVEQGHDFVPSSWESFAVSLSTRYSLSRLRHAEGKIRLWLFWRRTGRACTGGIALLDRARSRNSPNQRARQGCCPPAGRSDPVSPPPLPRLMRSALWAGVACCVSWFLLSADVMAWVAAALANECKGRGNRETGERWRRRRPLAIQCEAARERRTSRTLMNRGYTVGLTVVAGRQSIRPA